MQEEEIQRPPADDDPVVKAVAWRPNLTLRAVRRLTALALIVVVLAMWIWGNLAVRYSNLPGEAAREIAGWTFMVGSLALFLFLRSLWLAAIYFFGASLLIVLWWSMIGASNDRDWQPDLRTLAHAEIDGSQVTIRNVRNFDWITADEYVEGLYDKTFDLDGLQEVDLILSYWDELRAIAHTILSFGFEDGSRLAISIEIRREQGETYDTVSGLFKQYELYYVVADERDVIRVRSNRRGEEVYLYPTRATREDARALFLDYMNRINALAEEPEYYHTLFNNCTTNIVDHVNRVMPNPVSYGNKILLNGYSDELAYNLGWIDTDLSYADMRKHYYVSARAKAADDDPDFSARIREFPDEAAPPQ